MLTAKEKPKVPREQEKRGLVRETWTPVDVELPGWVTLAWTAEKLFKDLFPCDIQHFAILRLTTKNMHVLHEGPPGREKRLFHLISRHLMPVSWEHGSGVQERRIFVTLRIQTPAFDWVHLQPTQSGSRRPSLKRVQIMLSTLSAASPFMWKEATRELWLSHRQWERVEEKYDNLCFCARAAKLNALNEMSRTLNGGLQQK